VTRLDVVDGERAYPAHWEADVVLRDGGTAHIRPILPQDEQALQGLHTGQSPESIYLRFFAPMPRLSDRDLHHFTHVDHVDRVALVVTVGQAIIGVGRYDRIDPQAAEVAFNISDAHQGRGLGSVLLEHLSTAARENGIERFVAEVLPQNRKMLAVFTDAGYEVDRHLEDGVVSVSFDIDPTERSLAVMESREHRAEARSLRVLLEPRSLVLIGVSRRAGTIGHTLLGEVLASGYTGAIHVIHPEADSVLGITPYRRLCDVPGPVDLAVVAVPAVAVLDVVRECAEAGVRGLVVVSGGFAETGPEGLARQNELVRLARANGMRVIGPNSWGMINTDPAVRLDVTVRGGLPQAGRLGVFCQSGALSVAVLEQAARRGVGISSFVSAGNRADVSGNDCMQFWEEDARTDVVALYLESMGNPRKFSRIARRLARAKPVIVVTGGGSGFRVPPGHAVRPSHAPREAFDAMLKQSGCIRVESIRQLLDVGELVLHQGLPHGDRVAVVANSESLASLVDDACRARGLPVVHGPVAVPVLATAEEFSAALEKACADPDVDAVIAAFGPPIAARSSEVVAALAQAAAGSRPVVLACLLGMPAEARAELAGHPGRFGPVPAYPTPEEAVRALAAVSGYLAWRARDEGVKVDPPGRDEVAAATLVDQALAAHPEGLDLDPRRAAQLLQCLGVELWPALAVATPSDAVEAAQRLGYPVAVKATAAHLRHRVDLGGVRLDLSTPDQVVEAVTTMRERLTPLGGADLVVQAMAPAGVAVVVRSTEDPLFGPVVSFGVGGDASELLGDVALRIAPLTDVDVADMVRFVRASPKLFGHRGERTVDVAALEDLIARLACLADAVPELAEVELNPVVVTESGVAVLGARVRLAPVASRADSGRRELAAGLVAPVAAP
jgi:acyl-CoA synthetase (NDP forming)/RimJ/RimL family protein N-acetyltransferase